MKGVREPLLLLATGLFLSLAWNPLTGMVGAAGIALGAHDLRKYESAAVLGRWRGTCEIAAWCTCGLWIASLCGILLMPLEIVAQTTALCTAAGSAARLARLAGALRLARMFVILGCLPIAFMLLMAVAMSVPSSASTLLRIALLVQGVSCLSLAVLTLRVRALALPYGGRLARKPA